MELKRKEKLRSKIKNKLLNYKHNNIRPNTNAKIDSNNLSFTLNRSEEKDIVNENHFFTPNVSTINQIHNQHKITKNEFIFSISPPSTPSSPYTSLCDSNVHSLSTNLVNFFHSSSCPSFYMFPFRVNNTNSISIKNNLINNYISDTDIYKSLHLLRSLQPLPSFLLLNNVNLSQSNDNLRNNNNNNKTKNTLSNLEDYISQQEKEIEIEMNNLVHLNAFDNNNMLLHIKHDNSILPS